jgi:uncharacterized membrane protein YqgA involved in biofilm formation
MCHILLAPVGIGTAINVLAVLAGGSIGTLAGARLPAGHALDRVRVANMLPALLFAPLLVAMSPLWQL